MIDGKVNGGSDDADTRFEAFFVDAEPRLRAVLSAAYGAELGREAAAEALAWAYEHWTKVEAMKHPIAYLYRVGQSRTRPLRRRMPPVHSVHASPLPEIEPELDRALQSLPRRQRAAVVLVHGYGYTQAETAGLLGVKPTSVANHVNRALTKLRAELGVDDV